VNRHASVPPAAAAYFSGIGVETHGRDGHPVITHVFRPGSGWKPYPIRKRVSLSCLRQELSAGATHVTLASGGHSPDFAIAELLRSARKR
jgi:hypothetical protein